MRFSGGKYTAARAPCHTRGRSMKRGDPRGSQGTLAGNRDPSNTTARPSGAAVAGHKTSVSLEDPFWEGLKEIAKAKRQSLSELVGGIDTDREHGNLSSALRSQSLQGNSSAKFSCIGCLTITAKRKAPAGEDGA